jgi:hypothetical protein
MALDVLAVAGLLPDEQDARSLRALPEDGLRRVPEEIAALAALDGHGERSERAIVGEERLGRVLGHTDQLPRPEAPRTAS